MKNSKKAKLNHKKLFLYVGSVLLLVIVSIQALIDLSVYRNLVQANSDHGTVLATLIIDAVSNLNKPAPVEPATGRIYLPEAHLVLPTYSGLGQVIYLYEPGQNSANIATEIHLSSSQIFNMAKSKMWQGVSSANNGATRNGSYVEKIFAQVPSLQACTRGVQVFYTKQNLDGDYIFQGSHRVKDGRTLYVYSESNCHQDQTPIIKLAKQAQSY